MRKSYRLLIPLVLISLAGVSFWIWKKRGRPLEPEKSAEALFQQRQEQANSLLESPLAKLVLDKNWEQVKQAYPVEKHGVTIARIIRAMFIGGKMASFTQAEQDLLLQWLLQYIQSTPQIDPDTKGLVMAQAERLLPPREKSPSLPILNLWLKTASPSTPEYLLAVKKLVTQPAHPAASSIELLLQQIPGHWRKVQDNGLIFALDETRNPNAKGRILKQLLGQFGRLPSAQRAAALIVLARNLNGEKEKLNKIRQITIKLLASGTPAEFEAALRAILPIHRAQALSGAEIERVVKVLTGTPEAQLSPFARGRITEIISILQP